MLPRLLIYTLILIIILLVTGLAKADNLRTDEGGGIPDWHKPIPCVGCHREGINVFVGECDDCHEYVLNDKMILVSQLEQSHTPKICTACHMGNTMVNISTRDRFHTGHENVQCTKCHEYDNFNIIKIKIKTNGFQCVSCHGNEIHGIHVKNLTKICQICHGSWAKGKNVEYLKTFEKEQIAGNVENKERYGNVTIFDYVKSFINAIVDRMKDTELSHINKVVFS